MLSLRRLCIISGIHCRLYRRMSHAASATMSSSVWPGSIQEAWPESKEDTHTCSLHKINLDLICLTCGQLPICKVCATTQHKGHQLITKDQYASKCNEGQIQTHKDPNESITSILKSRIAAANDRISQNKTKLEDTKTKIDKQLSTIKQQADHLADLYTKQCEQCEAENYSSLLAYINHLQLLLDQIESDEKTNGSIQRHFPTGSIMTSPTPPEIPQTHFLQFKPSSESMEQFQKYFGDLLYCYSEITRDKTPDDSPENSVSATANKAGLEAHFGQHTMTNTSEFQILKNKLHSETITDKPENEMPESHNLQNVQRMPLSAFQDSSNQADFKESSSVHIPQMLSTKDQQRSTSPYLSSSNDTPATFTNTNTSPGPCQASKETISLVPSVPQPRDNEILAAGERDSSYKTYSASPPRQHIFPETIIMDKPSENSAPLQRDASARPGNQNVFPHQQSGNVFKNSKVTTNKGEQQVLNTTDAGYVKLSHEGKLILPDSEHRTIKSNDQKYDLPSPRQHRRAGADNIVPPAAYQERQYLETNLDEENIAPKTKHHPMTLLKDFVFKRDLETRIKSLLPFSNKIYLWFLRNLRFTIIDKSTGKQHLEDINSISNIIDVYLSPVDNTIWFCCWDGSVCQITKKGSIEKRLTADQSVRAICVTHDGNVVVSMDVKITLYNINGREIVMKRRRDLQLEEKTWKIADCGQTKRLAVSDKENIAVMDYKLNFLFRIQKGHTVSWASGACMGTGYIPIKLFEAWGLCFDADNNLLVCDTKNKCIVKFDKNGQYISTVREVNMFPQSISRLDGHLYVAYTETTPMQMDTRMSKQTQRRMMTNVHLLPDIIWHIQIFKE